jgi:hypothetical protein
LRYSSADAVADGRQQNANRASIIFENIIRLVPSMVLVTYRFHGVELRSKLAR